MALHEPIVATPAAKVPTPGAAGGHVFAVAGVVAGLGAIAASSCCMVPLTLASLGAGAGILGTLDAHAPWRIPLLVASAVGVAVAWFVWWRKRRVACDPGSTCAARPPSQAFLMLLILASLIVASALGWSHLELKLVQSA